MGDRDPLTITTEEEISIGKYKIKPWTLARLIKVSPEILTIRGICKSEGITLDSLTEDPFTAIVPLLPAMPGVLSVCLDIPRDEAEELKIDEVVMVVIVIIQQNIEYLQKLFGPSSVLMSTIRKMINPTVTK